MREPFVRATNPDSGAQMYIFQHAYDVCKTFIRRFNSDPRLQHNRLQIKALDDSQRIDAFSGIRQNPDENAVIPRRCQAFCQALSGVVRSNSNTRSGLPVCHRFMPDGSQGTGQRIAIQPQDKQPVCTGQKVCTAVAKNVVARGDSRERPANTRSGLPECHRFMPDGSRGTGQRIAA